MIYRYVLTYTPTDSDVVPVSHMAFPIVSDDLSIVVSREGDEMYYTRRLDGKIEFVRDDYSFIIGMAIDGTFTLVIYNSVDEGAHWARYFEGNFSRANLEIDEDNRKATLNGFTEDTYDIVENGKETEYDLNKIIPTSELKEVEGTLPPALALVDYRSDSISQSDMFCGGPLVSGGFKEGSGYSDRERVGDDKGWKFVGVYAEAKVTMADTGEAVHGRYAGVLEYGESVLDNYLPPLGNLYNTDGCYISLNIVSSDVDVSLEVRLIGAAGRIYITETESLGNIHVSPSSLAFDHTDTPTATVQKIEIVFHYIRASLLTARFPMWPFRVSNVLESSQYYMSMEAFQGSGLEVAQSLVTDEQSNGHRLIPDSDHLYFAPPDTTYDWIPLAEDNWNFASLWYRITPSTANGLLDSAKVGTHRWGHCWTVGVCVKYLLEKISGGTVKFAEATSYSQFLYGNPNPVEGHEPFEWLVTQKSNVMSPTATGASRCVVRLSWFLELLRNAFNCYWWLEKLNDGTYNFRVEHVEYFRRGGSYTGTMSYQTNVSKVADVVGSSTRMPLQPKRNFMRAGSPVKTYADSTNKYTYNLDGMVERYTFAWQGAGGGDDFKGHPMLFKAGWVEKGSSENHEVDNIFADLPWLTLNAGTAAESSKNYDGLFIFGGYRKAVPTVWVENAAPPQQYRVVASGITRDAYVDMWVTAPTTSTVIVETNVGGAYSVAAQFVGTGKPMRVYYSTAFASGSDRMRINFGSAYRNIVIHRMHSHSGNLYYAANLPNLLRGGYLQNGALAWPWLQNEYLHYNVPAKRWAYTADAPGDVASGEWLTNGTVKLVKRQTLGVVPVPNADPATDQGILSNLRDVDGNPMVGVIDEAKITLASRNCEYQLVFDPTK